MLGTNQKPFRSRHRDMLLCRPRVVHELSKAGLVAERLRAVIIMA